MNLYYKEHKASEILKPYVYGYWSMNSDKTEMDESPLQRCFPAGTIEWITTIRGKNMVGFAEKNRFVYPKSIFTGICDRAAEWLTYGNSELFGIRFTPEGAIRLFGIPLKEFHNRFLDAEDFLGSKITPIISNLIACESVNERLFLIESFLHHQIKMIQPEKNYFTEAIRIIRQSDQLNISDLPKKVYVGERQLQRSFQHNLGITPKGYYKVMRLYKAHQQGLFQKHNYTDIAYNMGYSDPAHFNRDFKEYFGVSPEKHFSATNMKWVS